MKQQKSMLLRVISSTASRFSVWREKCVGSKRIFKSVLENQDITGETEPDTKAQQKLSKKKKEMERKRKAEETRKAESAYQESPVLVQILVILIFLVDHTKPPKPKDAEEREEREKTDAEKTEIGILSV